MRIVMIANPIISEYQLSVLLKEKHITGDILACNQMNLSLGLLKPLKVDLFLTYAGPDTDLPGLTVLLRRLKTERPDLYVLILVNHDIMGQLAEQVQEAADDFISVPLEAEELAARLRIAERYVELLKRLAETQKSMGAGTSPELAPSWPMSIVEALDQTKLSQESGFDSTEQSSEPKVLSDQLNFGPGAETGKEVTGSSIAVDNESGEATTAAPATDALSFLPDPAELQEIGTPDPQVEKTAAQQASEALQAFLEKQKIESEQAEETGKRSSSRSRTLWLGRNRKLFINILSILILLLMSSVAFLAQCNTTGIIPSFCGYQTYVSFSNDMIPTFDKGSVVLTRYIRPQEVRVGDIITYTDGNGSTPISQRVVKIDVTQGLSFITRGDNNDADYSNPVPAERVIGKVYNSIANLGYFISFAQSKRGIIALIFIPALVLIPFEIRNIYKLFKQPYQEQE